MAALTSAVDFQVTAPIGTVKLTTMTLSTFTKFYAAAVLVAGIALVDTADIASASRRHTEMTGSTNSGQIASIGAYTVTGADLKTAGKIAGIAVAAPVVVTGAAAMTVAAGILGTIEGRPVEATTTFAKDISKNIKGFITDAI
jgi:hypothetical protein